jgi:hypothetical protein
MKNQIYFKVLLNLVIIVFFSCNYKNGLRNGNKLIIGRWFLDSKQKQINYPEVVFYNDSTAVFTSRGDSIYYFNYFLDGSSLILKNINNIKEKYEINKLTKDSLIFNDLRENEFSQIYTRRLPLQREH